MPKRNKKNRGVTSETGVVRVPFRCVWDRTTGAGSVYNALSVQAGQLFDNVPTSICTRLANISAQYVFFRLSEILITMHPSSNATASLQCLGWVPAGGGLTAPATLADIAEMTKSTLLTQNVTVPVKVRLSRKELTGQFPWFRCDQTGDSSEYQQGVFYNFINVSGARQLYHIKGVMEYRTPVDPTVAITRLRAVIAEEDERSQNLRSDESKQDAIASQPRLVPATALLTVKGVTPRRF